ncbi:MAG: branched-chain amino acid ABC transporter permease [SAR324 cluster bacterium]|nr:branched-chain amino acid ABC transporter permease [SAR324 cluster bacterium]
MEEFWYWMEVFVSGTLQGVMYSLVALGFVLIYKSSGVFNFAQGSMCLFGALGFVILLEAEYNFWFALLLAVGMMIVLAIAVDWVVLRPLTARPPITLFMATVGLAFFLEGLAQLVWGTQPHGLDIGISDLPFEGLPISISRFELFAAGISIVMIGVLVLFFHKTRVGRALRAVADDHEAALSVGISLRMVWGVTWAIAGIVALVAGIMWGTRLGVQYSLSLIVLKALAVLILGGFNSISGAIIAGVIVGAFEKLLDVGISVATDYQFGGTESFSAYLLALVVLLFKPYGLFGDEIIERV